MKFPILVFISCLIFILASQDLAGQKFVRLDKINTPITKKFYIGEELHFTLKQYPDVWRMEEITNLDFDSQSLVFQRDFLVIDQIDKVRTYRPWAKGLGINLYRFSASWFVFGGIIHAATDYKVDRNTAIIGGSAFVLGFIFDKLLYKKTHRLSSRWTLRVLDTNF